jgi:NADH:ubiquinone oxidoreductase subunit E
MCHVNLQPNGLQVIILCSSTLCHVILQSSGLQVIILCKTLCAM